MSVGLRKYLSENTAIPEFSAKKSWSDKFKLQLEFIWLQSMVNHQVFIPKW
jgi:hypothetical protein